MDKARFVHLVGQMPFSAKYKVRHFFTEGVRAARNGNEMLARKSSQNLGIIAGCNVALGAGGFFATAVSTLYGVSQETWQFIPEAALGLGAGIGHTLSAAAELIIRQRLQEVEIKESPPIQAQRSNQINAITEPTLLETALSTSAFAANMLLSLHVAAYEAITKS